MPLFSSSTPFDGDVEKATSEMNTTEDWSVIMDICDKVGRTPNGAKDCLKSVVKRLNHRIPHVSMQATTLLDAAVNNCGRAFHLEVASRDFVSEVRTLIGGKAHPKVSSQLKLLIKKWAQNDFKNDPALDMIPTLYNSLIKEGVDFTPHDQPPATSQTAPKDPNVVSSQQEEDDIAKAIALSLEEEEKKKTKTTSSSALYPAVTGSSSSSSSSPSGVSSSRRKVRALYDFEAAEDNELTFKAGEIISILDDSDANWWKGSTWRGEGLFPANFVTADLSVEIEAETAKEKKSVQFNEEVEVKEVETVPEVVEIDEDKIDKCLAMLQNADPTGETTPDQPEMVSFEEQCKAMGPLIDAELEKIDGKHNDLMDLNTKLMDALQMYHHLMKELPAYGYGTLPISKPGQFSMPPTHQMYNGQQPPVSMAPPQMPGGYTPVPPGVSTSAPPPYTGVNTSASSNGYSNVSMYNAGAPPPVDVLASFPPSGMPPQPIYSTTGSQPPPPPQQQQQQHHTPMGLPAANMHHHNGNNNNMPQQPQPAVQQHQQPQIVHSAPQQPLL